MSITIRGKGTNKRYLVRVEPFPSKIVYTRDAATRHEADLKNKKALGHTNHTEPNTLGHELDQYNERRNATGTYRPATISEHQTISRSWKTLRPQKLPNLTRQTIEDAFIERAKVAPVAANKELTWLKAVLREAAARGQQIDPGILLINPVQHKPRRGRALTVQQLYRLAEYMPDNIGRLIPLAGLVGARQSFWFQVTDDCIDLHAGTLTAPAALQKNDRDHRVYLADEELRLVREQLLARPSGTPLLFPRPNGERWNRNSFRAVVWVKARDAAAADDPVFDGFRFHWLRHTAGTLMALAGVEPPIAAERLGHTDGGALYLRTYRHLMAGERERAAKRLNAFVVGELRVARKRNVS